MSQIKKMDGLLEKTKNRYRTLTKLFFIIFLLFFILAVLIFIGAIYLGLGPTWAVISVTDWIVFVGGLIGFFIVLEIIFISHISIIKKRALEKSKPKPEYYNDKLINIFTIPKGNKGGVFSKTYMNIDGENILRLRTLIIPPETIWKKKED